MKKVLDNHLFMWKLCFKTCPGFMLYHMFDAFRYQFFVFIEHTLAIRYVLHCAEYGEPFWKAFVYVGAVLLGMMIIMIPDGYFNHALKVRSVPKLYQALKEQMYDKASVIDLKCYDDPEYYNQFVLAVAESESSIDRFLQLLTTLIQGLTVIFTTGIFYLLVNWQGLIFVGISFVCRFFLAKGLNKLNYEVRLAVNPKERQRNYISRVFYLKNFAKELRIYPGVASKLEGEFSAANEDIYETNKKVSLRRHFLIFNRDYTVGDFLICGVYVAYLVYCAAVLHTLDYSNAVVLFNRMGEMEDALSQLANVAPMAQENSLYIEKIRKFLDYRPIVEKEGGLEVPEGIGELTIDNLSFSYAENLADTLQDISLKVKAGEHIAIVGYNGAGKTTLIKLLMRLYNPTSGEIYYHKQNIKEFDKNSYRNRIGVVFQDYQLYACSLGENVKLDELTEAEYRANDSKISKALIRAGFGNRLDSLKDGLYTQVTCEFDAKGVDFSGGEGQKIAISRAFFADSDILIMDEPSSALDPIAEYELNHAMREAAIGKTVFYISHRLSTVKDADRIIMLEKGRIIEEGTHEQLTALNGKYAQMWKVQAGRY